jgi:hypothetical protein
MVARRQVMRLFSIPPRRQLAALWNEHGGSDSMYWDRGRILPITSEALDAHEDSWINSGDSDEYGAASYFIDAHYSDEEKKEFVGRARRQGSLSLQTR